MSASQQSIETDTAIELARRLYGLEVTASELPSYADRNFLLKVSDGARFVLKIANPDETLERLELQHAAMRLVARSDTTLATPRPVPALGGDEIVRLDFRDGSRRLVRLLSWLEGRPMAEARPFGPELLRDLGASLGRLDRALSAMPDPGIEGDPTWDLRNVGRLRRHLPFIDDPQRRGQVERWLLQFDAGVAPRLDGLPQGVLHNDANDYNLLVENGDGADRLCGIIDFGDMLFAPTIFELAIGCTYAMFGADDPIEVAVTVTRAYHTQRPLERGEVELLFGLIGARLCTSVCLSARTTSERPENAYISVSESDAWKLLDELSAHSPHEATVRLLEGCGMTRPAERLPDEALLDARRRQLGPSLSLSYRQPLQILRGEGAYLFDRDDRAYLDLVNNVAHVGHCHPRVVEAAAAQSAQLNTNTRYLHPTRTAYTRRLLEQFPDELSVCYLTCSGSEANDLALRLARCATGGRAIVVVDGAYHGNLSSLIAISPYKFAAPGGDGAPDHVHVVSTPDRYRGGFTHEDVGAAWDGARREKQRPAAFICESLLGCAGQIVLPDGYLAAAYRQSREAGALCIADEVQVGFGRVGSHFWGFETQGVVPDIVTLGKPIGNGHPLSAVITTREVADAFDNGMEYFNTFGGNPVSCAVGLAVLDVIGDERLQERALRVGSHLLDGLKQLRLQHDLIGDVRGLGLFVGIELVEDRTTRKPAAAAAARIVERLKQRGILLSIDGPRHNVLKIKPPLVVGEEQMDAVAHALDEALGAEGR